MTALVGIVVLITVAGAFGAMRDPSRIGRIAALCLAGYVASVLVWSAISGDLLRRSGLDASTAEGCGQERVC